MKTIFKPRVILIVPLALGLLAIGLKAKSEAPSTAEAICVGGVVTAVKFKATAPGIYLIPIDSKQCPKSEDQNERI